MRSKLLPFIFSYFVLLLSGCVNLKPVPSEMESYALGPVEVSIQEEAQTSGESIYIIRPQVPTYLDGTRLSYRLASGEVKDMVGARWAEPLPEGIARAMSLFLSKSSLGIVEGYYPWANTSSEASRLSLNFQRFGANGSGEVNVVVLWTLKQSGGKTRTGQFVSSDLDWQVGRPDTLVAAYNEALQALALDIEKNLNLR